MWTIKLIDMKKLILLAAVLMFVVASFAQTGVVKSIATLAVNGNNNFTSAAIPVTGSYGSLFISVAVTRVSTAAGGTLYLKSGLAAASILEINQSTNPGLSASPNDTLVTADVATQYWNLEIKNPGASKYYIFADGDVNDTISVATTYMYK